MVRGHTPKSRVILQAKLVALGLTVSVASAVAAPRRVAVVNLATDQSAGQQAATRLRTALAAKPELAPIPAGDLSRALENRLPRLSAAERQMARVRALFSEARKAKAMFAYATAQRRLAAAETILLGLAPGPRVNKLLAETNFRSGLVHAANNKPDLALRAFRSVRRLDPKREHLDPSVHPPRIVNLYARAATTPNGNARTKVTTTYDGALIHLDGRVIGKTPITIALSPGIHYVVAALPGYRPSGAKLTLADGAAPPTRLRLRSLRIDERARLLRRAELHRSTYLEAGRQVARLAQVDAVIIIAGTRDKLAASVYDTRSDLVGTWRRFGTASVATILAPLLPLPRVAFPDPKFIVPGPGVRKQSWHDKLWVRIGGGVVAVVVSAIAISFAVDTSTPMTQPDSGIGFTRK